MLSKKYLKFLILFFIFLLLLRFDFRQTIPSNTSLDDDASYYFHSKSITYDFDFDYSNQLDNSTEEFYHDQNNKPVPKHPVGPGIFASPFMFIGKVLDYFFDQNIYNYLLYSLSSIFYLFISITLLMKIFKEKTKNFIELKNYIYLYYFGSGIIYFAFQRFSMSHVYEIFASSFILYLSFLSEKRKTKNINNLNFLIGFLSILFLFFRWTNYFLIILPLFYFILFKRIDIFINNFLRNIYYWLGLIFGVVVFLFHTKLLYGIYTFNPSDIYLQNLNNTIILDFFNSSLVNVFSKILKNTLNILFSLEFGLLYISPIIFLSLVVFIKFLMKKEYLLFFVLSIIYLVPFSTAIVWQTTASSFGYRYLYCLIPVSLLVVFANFELQSFKFFKFYLVFPIFSIVAYLFFQTTDGTSLSANINSFGVYHNYSSPNFVFEVLHSILLYNSYLKIFFTSYLGIFLLYILSLIFSSDKLVHTIDEFGYLNSDVENLLNYTNNLNFLYFFVLLIFVVLLFRINRKLLN